LDQGNQYQIFKFHTKLFDLTHHIHLSNCPPYFAYCNIAIFTVAIILQKHHPYLHINITIIIATVIVSLSMGQI